MITPYAVTVKKMATRVFHNYMSGSNQIWCNVPIQDIAAVYNVNPYEFESDIDTEYQSLLKAQYAKA
jgi:hypothetical protein